MRIEYIPRVFRGATQQVILHAEYILNEYADQGYTLTVRALYYKFIARDLFPEDRRWRRIKNSNRWVRDPNGTKNATPNYKWLGEIVNNARLAGLIDWELLEDLDRELEEEDAWKDPREIMQASADQYHMDRWENQQHRPEIWVEKKALLGIIEAQCKKIDVPYIACKGYMSASAMWESGQRMIKHIENGYMPVIFHLGDHDPSGLDMGKDIVNRLDLFLGYDDYEFGEHWRFERIALNMEQIREYDPPPQPAKPGDSRSRVYEAQYGPDCWELDSMEPDTMNSLIEEHVHELIDQDRWEEVVNREADHREAMQKAIKGMQL